MPNDLWEQIQSFTDESAMPFKDTAGLAVLPADVAAAPNPGAGELAAANHVHRGVGAIEVEDTYLRGDVALVRSTNIDIVASGKDRTVTFSLEDDIVVDSVTAQDLVVEDLYVDGVLRVDDIRPAHDSPDEHIEVSTGLTLGGVLRVDEILPASDSPSGDVLITGNVEVSSDLSVGDDLAVAGSVLVAEDLTVDGVLRVDEIRPESDSPSAQLLIAGDLAATGSVSVGAALEVAGDLSTSGVLRTDEIRPDSDSPEGSLLITCGADIQGALTVGGSAYIDGILYSDGGLYTDIIAPSSQSPTGVLNVDGTDITSTQWGYLGAMDQDVSTGADVEFNSIQGAALTLTGNISLRDNQSLLLGDDQDFEIYFNATDLIINWRDPGMTGVGGKTKIGTTGDRALQAYFVEVAAAGGIFHGDYVTNDTWRVARDGTGLVTSVRVAGAYVEQMRVAPSMVTLTGNLTVGQGAAGVDYTLTFDGQDNDGVITWMEDEDYFQFGDDLVMAAGESLDCATLGGYLKPRRVRQAARPTPEAGELMVWCDSDDDSVYLVYNDANGGVAQFNEV